jgi:hypothetical protein
MGRGWDRSSNFTPAHGETGPARGQTVAVRSSASADATAARRVEDPGRRRQRVGATQGTAAGVRGARGRVAEAIEERPSDRVPAALTRPGISFGAARPRTLRPRPTIRPSTIDSPTQQAMAMRIASDVVPRSSPDRVILIPLALNPRVRSRGLSPHPADATPAAPTLDAQSRDDARSRLLFPSPSAHPPATSPQPDRGPHASSSRKNVPASAAPRTRDTVGLDRQTRVSSSRRAGRALHPGLIRAHTSASSRTDPISRSRSATGSSSAASRRFSTAARSIPGLTRGGWRRGDRPTASTRSHLCSWSIRKFIPQ